MSKQKSVFETLSAVNVNDKVEKKGKLTYLSWAWAWGEVKKNDIQMPVIGFIEIKKNKKLPMSFVPEIGGFCYTSVTINGNTLPMWLPILDNRNQTAMKPNAFQINSTLMRCLTKNLAMHGLGHYIYAGEDLPAQESKPQLTKSDLLAVLNGTIENAREVLNSYEVNDEYKQQITNKFKK